MNPKLAFFFAVSLIIAIGFVGANYLSTENVEPETFLFVIKSALGVAVVLCFIVIFWSLHKD